MFYQIQKTRPPLIQPNCNSILEQTQAFIRLVYQQRQHQLLVQQQQQQQQQQQHLRKEHLHFSEIHERVANFSQISVIQELEQKPEEVQDSRSTKRGAGKRSDIPGDHSTCADWSVDQVCHFVASVELCKPYVEVSTQLGRGNILYIF